MIETELRKLLESYAEPCAGDCEHSQCPLLRELYELQIKATLERARLTVKPIVDKERESERVTSDIMDMRLRAAAATAAPQQSDAETLVKQWVATLQDESHVTDEDAEDLVFRIIAYKTTTAAPVEQLDEVAALRNTNILCRSGEGRPKVEIWFKDLKAAQRIHKWLVSLAVTDDEGAR